MSGPQSLALPVQIVGSALAADFARLGEDCQDLEKAGVDRIQWDVMDGQFVPNLTFGPGVVAAARARVALPFEAHLMVADPQAWSGPLIQAGCVGADVLCAGSALLSHPGGAAAAVAELRSAAAGGAR